MLHPTSPTEPASEQSQVQIAQVSQVTGVLAQQPLQHLEESGSSQISTQIPQAIVLSNILLSAAHLAFATTAASTPTTMYDPTSNLFPRTSCSEQISTSTPLPSTVPSFNGLRNDTTAQQAALAAFGLSTPAFSNPAVQAHQLFLQQQQQLSAASTSSQFSIDDLDQSMTSSSGVGSARAVYNKFQRGLLNCVFQHVPYPTRPQRDLMADKLGGKINQQQIKVWFQNARRRAVMRSKNGLPNPDEAPPLDFGENDAEEASMALTALPLPPGDGNHEDDENLFIARVTREVVKLGENDKARDLGKAAAIVQRRLASNRVATGLKRSHASISSGDSSLTTNNDSGTFSSLHSAAASSSLLSMSSRTANSTDSAVDLSSPATPGWPSNLLSGGTPATTFMRQQWNAPTSLPASVYYPTYQNSFVSASNGSYSTAPEGVQSDPFTLLYRRLLAQQHELYDSNSDASTAKPNNQDNITATAFPTIQQPVARQLQLSPAPLARPSCEVASAAATLSSMASTPIFRQAGGYPAVQRQTNPFQPQQPSFSSSAVPHVWNPYNLAFTTTAPTPSSALQDLVAACYYSAACQQQQQANAPAMVDQAVSTSSVDRQEASSSSSESASEEGEEDEESDEATSTASGSESTGEPELDE